MAVSVSGDIGALNPPELRLESAAPGALAPGAFWSSRAGEAAISVLIGCAFFLLLRATPDSPGGFDAYRHARMASRLLTEPRAVFADPWRLAYFWPKPVDAWFGYHLLLAPFTAFLDPIVAIKLLSAILFGATAWVLFLLLRYYEASYRWAWVLLALTGSSVTLCRATLTRPFLLSVLLTLAAALFTVRGRTTKLLLVSALHALSYSIFFLVALAPGLWLLMRRDRQSLRAAGSCGAGIVVGLLLSPYFPQNVRFDLVQSAVTGIAQRTHVLIGGELHPMSSWWWVATSLPVLFVWICALVVGIRRGRASLTPATGLLLAASAISLAGTFLVGRTADFFVPFAILFAAVVLSPRLPACRRDLPSIGVLLALCCGVYVGLTCQYVLEAPGLARFRGAAEYLRTHARGELVANADWGDYYFLYYLNPASRYVVGIEPTMMYLSGADKYWLWRHVSDDETATCPREHCADGERQDIATAFRTGLGARYIFTEHAVNPRVEARLLTTPDVTKVYRDSGYSIYRLGE
jgi:hypothetical protein